MLNYTIVFMKKCCNNTIITKDLWQQQKLKNGPTVVVLSSSPGFVVWYYFPSLNNTHGLGHNFAPFVTLIDKLSFCEGVEIDEA